MRKNILISMIALFALAACNRGDKVAPVEYTEYDDSYDNVIIYQNDAPACAGTSVRNTTTNTNARRGTSVVKYSVPNDSDLTLETAHHIIQIEGNPNKSYGYYVWAGDKDYSDDPDLIVEDGIPAVLRSAE